MSDVEYSEFDASVEQFESAAKGREPDSLPLPGIFGQMKEWMATPFGNSGMKAKQAAQKIYATFKVVRAARGLLGSTAEAQAYSRAIDALKDEYDIAWAAALNANSGNYSITDRLKEFTATLKDAVSRVKSNTQAMNSVSEFIAGGTAFVGALA